MIIGGLFLTGQVLLLGLIGLALLPLCKWLARAQLSGLTFTRQLPRRVFSGERFGIEITANNAKQRIEASDLFLSDPMMDAASRSVPLPFIGCRTSHDMVWTGRLFRRGWNRQNRITVTSRWPLGLFEARLETEFRSPERKEGGVLVVPRPLTPVFLTKTLGQLEKESALLSTIPPDTPSEFRYLREFQSGDAIRSIHWSSSTRSGKLYVKETDPPSPTPSRYGLLIHAYTPPGAVIRNAPFETTLRIATGLVVALQKQNTPFLFSASFASDAILRYPEKTGFSTILDHIAEAPVRFTTDLDSALISLVDLASCDQVFVIGSAPRSSWECAARDIAPSCIVIDPENLSSGPAAHRRPLLRKASGS